jgi:hypothetical protein
MMSHIRGKNVLCVDTGGAQVVVAELVAPDLGLLLGEGLRDLHAAEGVGDEPMESPHPIPPVVEGAPEQPPELAHEEEEDGQRDHRNKRELPVHGKEDHAHADDSEKVYHQEREREGEQVLDPVGVLGQPRDDGACRMVVVVPHGQPLKALVELGADVEADARAEPGCDPVAPDLHAGVGQARTGQAEHEPDDQVVLGPGAEHVVDKDHRQVRRDHPSDYGADHETANEHHAAGVGLGES